MESQDSRNAGDPCAEPRGDLIIVTFRLAPCELTYLRAVRKSKSC